MWRCDYRTHVLTISYIDLVIFAHVAQARVGEENFQYLCILPASIINKVRENTVHFKRDTVTKGDSLKQESSANEKEISMKIFVLLTSAGPRPRHRPAVLSKSAGAGAGLGVSTLCHSYYRIGYAMLLLCFLCPVYDTCMIFIIHGMLRAL